MTRAAVILCGCGRFDGSEVQEAVLALLHLERLGCSWMGFAPDAPQWAVCDHRAGQVEAGAARNQLAEAARITRGQVRPLSEARAADFELLVLPGGSGAARNLADFAERGSQASLQPELATLIRDFHQRGKPIAALCIAPALVALALGQHQPTLTLGPPDGLPAQQAAGTGAQWVDCPVDEAIVDRKHRLVSTPAYILGPDLRSIDQGIARCLEQAVALAQDG